MTRIATLMLTLPLLIACGQKGPLYLPEDAPPQTAAEPAGNAVDEDDDEEEDRADSEGGAR